MILTLFDLVVIYCALIGYDPAWLHLEVDFKKEVAEKILNWARENNINLEVDMNDEENSNNEPKLH